MSYIPSGLPYFKFLKKEGRDIGQSDFARLQRESLETYLINLIRAVVRSQLPSIHLRIQTAQLDVSPVRESTGRLP